MGSNTFQPLKNVKGARRVAKPKPIGADDSTLIGPGLCTGMSMLWLKEDTVPAAGKKAAALQKIYSSAVDENISKLGKPAHGNAFEEVAKECGFRVPHRLPETDRTMAYWESLGPSLGYVISRYANGELSTSMHKLPSFLFFQLSLAEAEVKGETVDEKGEPWANYQPLVEVLTDGHLVALKPGDDFHRFYDPNVGVYEIEKTALKRFFDALYRCYEDFYKDDEETEDWVDQGLKNVVMDLRLARIYAVKPK